MGDIKIRGYREADVVNCLLQLFSVLNSTNSHWWNIVNVIHRRAMWGKLP